MKCIQCYTDNNLRDRTANSGRCKNCNHAFAFEPTSMTSKKFTDPFFKRAIAEISANNTLFFTPKQFLYLLEKRLKPQPIGVSSLGCLYFISGAFVAIIISVTLSKWFGDVAFLIAVIVFNCLWIYYLFNRSKSQTLRYEDRQYSATTLQFLGGFILVVGVWPSISINSFVGYASATLLGLTSLWLGIWQMRKIATNLNTSSLSISTFLMQSWLDKWMRINGSIDKLLPIPQTLSASTIPPDVTAYSFDRVVVCDSDAMANMLIANNFHFENNCAILAISGYPQNIFEITMQMLRRNSELRVYALHNCDPVGVSLVHQLRSPNWFPDHNITIIDVGLLPRQITAKPGIFIQTLPDAQTAQLPIEVRQGLSAAELEWLDAGNFVELESFTPQKIIQILQRSINTNREINIEDEGIIFVSDSDNSIYAVESFG